MPAAIIHAENPLPYTRSANLLYGQLDEIGMKLCSVLENEKIEAVPLPCDVPYLSWDEIRKHGMGILSMRHTAWLAGLGILGRNTLLINRRLGNLVYIGAILINADLETDHPVNDFACPPNCRLCLDSCPVGALNGTTVNQKLCREISCIQHPRGWEIYTCNECRKVCPWREGVEGR
jgi:epoxyqueuosine reductase